MILSSNEDLNKIKIEAKLCKKNTVLEIYFY